MSVSMRTLGRGLTVSSVGLGCMGMTHAYGAPADEKEMAGLLSQAVEMGYTFFDTAECYTGIRPDGTTTYNEELVGKALKPWRDQIVLATKFGVRHTGTGLEMDSRPERIRRALEGSLKRLQTDHIDLYYQHRMDPKVPAAEVAGVMSDLMREGKITHWGISEATEEYLRAAHAVCPVTAIQNRYSIMARGYETLFPTLAELGVGFVAFSPLGNGFLTARYDQNSKFEPNVDFRSRMPQFTMEGMERGRALLELLRTLAAEKEATPAQISLAWMLAKRPWIVPIPGSRKPERLRENLGGADVALTDDKVQKIDRVLDSLPETAVFQGTGTNEKRIS